MGPRQLTANKLTANNTVLKHIFTIPRAILPKPSLCDEITATKSVMKSLLCGQFVGGQFVAVSWLGSGAIDECQSIDAAFQ